MAVKHKKAVHRHHSLVQKMHKAVDEFADKVADKVVHEMKETRKEERKEHKMHKHPKGCKCATHRKKT